MLPASTSAAYIVSIHAISPDPSKARSASAGDPAYGCVGAPGGEPPLATQQRTLFLRILTNSQRYAFVVADAERFGVPHDLKLRDKVGE